LRLENINEDEKNDQIHKVFHKDAMKMPARIWWWLKMHRLLWKWTN